MSSEQIAAHDDRVREQFRIQATTFAQTGFAIRGLQWIIDTLRPRKSDIVLDVACGAAHLSRALAMHVQHVSGIDLTPEMLQQAQKLALDDGIRNLTLLQGNACTLPWIDGQFDLTACRLTLHQVADPKTVVEQMVRVTREDGRIAIIDFVVEDDPIIAAESNRLERLRDPSHGRTLTQKEMRSLLEQAGAKVVSTARQDNPLDLEDWMERTQTPSETRVEIRRRFEQEVAGSAPPTGLRPSKDEKGVWSFVHTWIIMVAVPCKK